MVCFPARGIHLNTPQKARRRRLPAGWSEYRNKESDLTRPSPTFRIMARGDTDTFDFIVDVLRLFGPKFLLAGLGRSWGGVRCGGFLMRRRTGSGDRAGRGGGGEREQRAGTGGRGGSGKAPGSCFVFDEEGRPR